MTRTPKRRTPRRAGLAGAAAALLLALAGCETNAMLREKGYDALREQDYASARERFAQAAERRPTDVLAQYYLGLTQLRLDRPLDAQIALERALTLSPDAELRPKVLDLLAEALHRQGRDEALSAFLAEAATQSGDPRDYLRQARYMVEIGDLDAAKLAFRKAAYFADPDDPTPYLAIADFYASVNDVPHAVEALRYAAHINPEAPGLADRFRRFGIVPGPTQRAEPVKPELLR